MATPRSGAKALQGTAALEAVRAYRDCLSTGDDTALAELIKQTGPVLANLEQAHAVYVLERAIASLDGIALEGGDPPATTRLCLCSPCHFVSNQL